MANLIIEEVQVCHEKNLISDAPRSTGHFFFNSWIEILTFGSNILTSQHLRDDGDKTNSLV